MITLADDDAWKGIINDFAKQLHAGKYKIGQIPSGIYFKTANKLAEAIANSSFSTDYNDPGNALAAQLRANLFQFSAAKSLTEAVAFSDALVDDEGKLKPFNQYRKDIQELHGLYNETYLSAEYQNAIAQAQAADQWQQWKPEDWLRYSTVGDDRVRPKHAKLDGLILQAKSPVWKSIYPPNDWGCRCTVVPDDEPKEKVSDKDAGELARAAVERGGLFDNNPGATGIIYKDDHLYFQSMKGIRELDAVRNYGMRSVDRIMRNADDFPPALHLDTETDYYIWWNAQVKKSGINPHDFVVKDKLGNDVLFTASPDGKNKASYFRDHIIRKQNENRHEYAPNMIDMIKHPDEIFVRYHGEEISTHYIKYYNDFPHLLITSNDGKVIKAQTMYRRDIKKNKASFDAHRKGILIYKR
jgi:SPP1 gp7 family putative phage head morphogenesis protein